MTGGEKIEFSKFVIGRYDHYFDSVNNKANFWLAFNTFSMGVAVTLYSTAKDVVPAQVSDWFGWGLVLFLIVSVASSFLILQASWPRLNKRKQAASSTRSLLYFDDVAAVDISDYRDALKRADEQALELDCATQIHQLANGLSRKYQRLSIAGRLMAVQLGLFLFLIAIVVIGKLIF